MIAETYVINLDASRERWRYMQRVLRTMRAPNPRRFVAVDGEALDAEQIAALQATDQLTTDLDHFDADSGRGEIGCALSHRGVLADIVARRVPAALILEDDIALPGAAWRWPRRFARVLADLPADWEIWYLYRCFDIAHRVTRLTRRLVVPWSPQGGAAYAVTLAGAEKLLRAMTPVGDAVDRTYANLVRQRGIVAYAASPLLVVPGDQRSVINRGNAREWVEHGINRPPEYWPKKYFHHLGEAAPPGLFYWRQDIANFFGGVRYRLRRLGNRA